MERPKPIDSMKKLLTKVIDTFKPNEFDIYEHAFEIQMTKRSYLFYTETEIESKRWVRVLSLLVSMKQDGLSLTRLGINPFDYEKYLVSKQILPKIERYDTKENEDAKPLESLADHKLDMKQGNFKTAKTIEIVP